MIDPDLLYGMPTAPELVGAVTEFLEKEVAGQLVGRPRFHLRVAVNVLNIVRRQIERAEDHARLTQEALASLGVASEQELADGIRVGDFDGRVDLPDVLRRLVTARLEVNNPTYLETYS
jgi:hypothetical protein